MVWQVGGVKGHGAELMINIAIVSMHAILYIRRHSWPHLCDECGGHAHEAPYCNNYPF